MLNIICKKKRAYIGTMAEVFYAKDIMNGMVSEYLDITTIHQHNILFI